MATTVKWLGNNIKDDTNHRLVTDNMIEKWNKVDNVDDNVQWIELTPENISQYTTTKAAGDWEDLGFEEIFDSDSLPEGNYIIKLGMDKLIPMDSVAAPEYKYIFELGLEILATENIDTNMDKTEFIKKYEISISLYDEISSSYPNENEATINQMAYIYNYYSHLLYLNYAIEPNTFIFLCQFFNVNFSLQELLDALEIYKIPCKLNCGTLIKASLSFGEEYIVDFDKPQIDRNIMFPECIYLKKRKRMMDKNTELNSTIEIYSKLQCIDYYNTYNYEFEFGYIDGVGETLVVNPCDLRGKDNYNIYDFQTKSYIFNISSISKDIDVSNIVSLNDYYTLNSINIVSNNIKYPSYNYIDHCGIEIYHNNEDDNIYREFTVDLDSSRVIYYESNKKENGFFFFQSNNAKLYCEKGVIGSTNITSEIPNTNSLTISVDDNEYVYNNSKDVEININTNDSKRLCTSITGDDVILLDTYEVATAFSEFYIIIDRNDIFYDEGGNLRDEPNLDADCELVKLCFDNKFRNNYSIPLELFVSTHYYTLGNNTYFRQELKDAFYGSFSAFRVGKYDNTSSISWSDWIITRYEIDDNIIANVLSVIQ